MRFIGVFVAVWFACGVLRARAETPLVLFSPNGGVAATIEQQITQTKDSLDIAMYSYSNRTLWTVVEQAAQRGVLVRLILNKAGFSTSTEDCPRCLVMEQAGVSIRWMSRTMHMKFAIADGHDGKNYTPDRATLMTGSGNWSNSSDSRYDEDFLLFRNSPGMITAHQREFNLLWSQAQEFDSPATTDAPVHDVTTEVDSRALFTSANVKGHRNRDGKWIFRKQPGIPAAGVVGDVVIAAIDNATTSLRIATAHYRRADFHQAVVRAIGRGVAVAMVTDGQELDFLKESEDCAEIGKVDGEKLDECLARAHGVEVRYKTNSPYFDFRVAEQMHVKYLVVDEVRVLTGTLNWSQTAEFKNFENLLVLDDPQIAARYEEHFHKVYNYGSNQLETTLQAIADAGGQGPCRFGAVAVTAPQFLRIRRAYQRGACR